MALQLGALRDALLSAGADPQKADEAAAELASYDRDIAVIKWMVGGLYVLGAPSIWLLLRVAAKIGAL
jgi:hypothetical protein